MLAKKLHVCQEAGCGKTFKYASKLKKHEESHGKATLLSLTSNSEQDLPRGGRKRECPTIEILLRKRVRLPKEEFHYDSWLCSVNMD
ncbi:hypothetical protein QQ045_014185 [Rhodiola kirilowii]